MSNTESRAVLVSNTLPFTFLSCIEASVAFFFEVYRIFVVLSVLKCHSDVKLLWVYRHPFCCAFHGFFLSDNLYLSSEKVSGALSVISLAWFFVLGLQLDILFLGLFFFFIFHLFPVLCFVLSGKFAWLFTPLRLLFLLSFFYLQYLVDLCIFFLQHSIFFFFVDLILKLISPYFLLLVCFVSFILEAFLSYLMILNWVFKFI